MSKKSKRVVKKANVEIACHSRTILCRCKRHYKRLLMVAGMLIVVGGVVGYLESIHCLGVEEGLRHILVTIAEEEA